MLNTQRMTLAAPARGGIQRSFAALSSQASSFPAAHPRLVRWLLLLTVTYVALISVPDPPKPRGTGLDTSWVLGLNLAHARGMAAGRDVIFTYGPLGYLVHPEPASSTPVLAFVYRIGLYLLGIAALCRLVLVVESKGAAFWTSLILGLAVVLDALREENQVMLAIIMLALLTLVDRSRWRFAELVVLGSVAGLAAMVKLNQGVEGTALYLVVLATVVFQAKPVTPGVRRQALAAACVLPLSIVTLFLASTGSVLALGPYVRYGWEIVSGYSEAMGLPGPLWQAALACATTAASLITILAVAGDLRSLRPGFAPALIVAYFVFKHAMTRQDPGHAPAFQVNLAVALLFLLISARKTRDRRLILGWQVFSVAMGYAVLVESYPGFDSEITARLEVRQVYKSWAAFRHWPATWAGIGAANEASRSKLRLPNRFQQLIQNGTVDAIPWDIDLVEANGWKWRPRPVFQSYTAYTPALDRLNARHLESDRTADFVILNFAAIDGRHPFLETPLSWRALLDRYDLKLAGDWMLLEHRKTSRYEPLVPLGASAAHWDEDVPVPPAGGLLVMGPNIRPSLSGRMMAALFRSGAVYMEGRFSSGRRVRWRSVPRNLAAGFLIRPFPQDLQELRTLFLPDPFRNSPDQIVSVRFHADKPGEFDAEIPIEWSRLPVKTAGEALDSPRYPLPSASLTPLWRPKDRRPAPLQAQVRAHRNWVEVTPATDDPQLLFDLGTGLGRFRTLIVRARFEKADRIDAFFGKQVDGRGINGVVPVAHQWLDVYLNMSHNSFWEDEHGTVLRFDPVSSAGPGTAASIAGIWGSTQAAPPAWPDIEFYPVLRSEAPDEWSSGR